MEVGRSLRLVGRGAELAALRQWLAAAGAGRGGLYVVAGEPGVGKSRLAAEALGGLPSWLVARGRATDTVPAAPLRPLAEALLTATRDRALPEDPAVRAFAAALGHLVPAWRVRGAAEQSVVVIAESALRVLRALAGASPAVLLVEDVQWADPETLSVLEYLADTVAGQPLAVLVTVRADAPSPGLAALRTLAARRVATILELRRLGPDDARAMAREYLGPGQLGEGIHALLDRADGLPFLIEELVTTGVRQGVLVRRDGAWTIAGSPEEILPESYRESVSRRLRRLPPRSALLTRIAAIAGPGRHVSVLSAAAGAPVGETWTALENARDAGLLALAGPERLVEFPHALIREAILADLEPVARGALASTALDALLGPASADPAELPTAWAPTPDEVLELAADLAEQAGELTRSAQVLLALALRAAASGALVAAEAYLRRARRRTSGDPALTVRIEESLLDLLAAKGDLLGAGDVVATALAAVRRLGGDPSRESRLHLALSRCAAAAGDAGRAADEAAHAQALAAAAGDSRLGQAADVAAAEAAVEGGDPPGAAALARQVIAGEEVPPETLVRAWMVVGRADRVRDLDAAAAAFDAAHALALRTGDALAELAALHERATIAMLAHGDDVPLLAARSGAERVGAVSLVTHLDLQLAGTYALTARPAQALAAAARARELAHRLQQRTVEAVAAVQAATAHAIREDERAMRAAGGEALALGGDHADVVAGLWGHAYGLHALLREDRRGARDALDRAVAAAGDATGIHGLFWAPWALVTLLDAPYRRREEEILRRVDAGTAAALPLNRGLTAYAHAVSLGTLGDADQAARMVAEAERVLSALPAFGFWRHVCLRLTAEAAIAGGWGDPVSWLRECLAAFDTAGHARVATACRVLLAGAGARVPRRRGGEPAPVELAALGVTGREAEVLALLAEGLGNREIGERLFLSPRTVEKHVERLLAKTGTANRTQLVAKAARRDRTLGT